MGRSFLKVGFSKRCHGPKVVIVEFTGMSVCPCFDGNFLPLDCIGANLGFLPPRHSVAAEERNHTFDEGVQHVSFAENKNHFN